MSYPNSWLTEPPEIPEEGSLPNNQMRQYASFLRKLAKEGSATDLQIEYLYAYEQRFTPEHLRTVWIVPGEQPPEAAAPAPAAAPTTPAQQLPDNIAREVAGVLKEIAASVKELRTGFNDGIKQVAAFSENALGKMDTNYAGALDKLSEGIDKLSGAQQNLTTAYGQLTEDHRSFLGVIFPHVSQMYTTTNESMAAYRQSLVDTANAEKIRATAEAANSIESEAGRSVLGLLTKAAERKFLGDDAAPTTPAPTTPAPEAPKAG